VESPVEKESPRKPAEVENPRRLRRIAEEENPRIIANKQIRFSLRRNPAVSIYTLPALYNVRFKFSTKYI
jgi:hypothetical protein